MKQHDANIDDRIHAFIAGKTSRTLSDSVADWLHDKFGGRGNAFKGETVVGIKYEPASRGKF